MLHRALNMLRIYHKMTQQEVADLVGITKSYVSEIEASNKEPSFEIIKKYAQAFEIPVSSLLFFAENLKDNVPAHRVRKTIASKVLKMLEAIAKTGRLENAKTN